MVHGGILPSISRFMTQLLIYVREVNLQDLEVNNNTVFDLQCMKEIRLVFAPKSSKMIITIRWMPPPYGFIKINTDGSEIHGCIQGGAIFRNFMGFVEAAYARKMGKGFSYEAELWAAIESVSVVIMKEWTKIEL